MPYPHLSIMTSNEQKVFELLKKKFILLSALIAGGVGISVFAASTQAVMGNHN